MKRSTLLIIILILIALGLGGLFALAGRDDSDGTNTENTTASQQITDDTTSQNQEPPAGEAGTNEDQAAATDEVEIEDFAFKPASITVKKGTTVTWTNKDDVQHNVVPDSGDSANFQGSELLAKGESYSFTFNTPGTYAYHCGPHPQMTGSVTVTE